MKVFGDIATIKNGSENVCTRVWVVLKRKSTPIVLRLTLHKINKKKIIEKKSTCMVPARDQWYTWLYMYKGRKRSAAVTPSLFCRCDNRRWKNLRCKPLRKPLILLYAYARATHTCLWGILWAIDVNRGNRLPVID